jgi:SNF2 family DNA or RNA helicase
VGLELDDTLRTLLSRARDEARLVQDLLGEEAKPNPPSSTVVGTTQGRYVRELRGFQKRDLAKLLSLPHGANFSVPGAGKTAVTYALYEAERLRGRVRRLLVVAPISAFEAWETEARECFSVPPEVARYRGAAPRGAEVLLVNYQRLGPRHIAKLAAWCTELPTQVVLDEAHRMKRGMRGEWGRACLQLAHVAVRRDILTGTPAPQSPSDFVALLDYLWPNQARRILPATALHREPPAGSMELVNRAIGPLFARTTKSELGLTAPTLRVERLPLKGLQADIYEALRNRYRGMFAASRIDRSNLAKMGEVAMYLLEAAGNPALLTRARTAPIAFRYPSLAIPKNSQLAELVARYDRHEIPAKFKRLAAIVDRNSRLQRKTLVWSNFVGNLLSLEKILAPHQPALVYGGIPVADGRPGLAIRTREGELARFRSNPKCHVLLANPAALGEGVSLHQACHDAVYLDRTFNGGQYLQSLDRIHRLGLAPTQETRVTFLMTTGTIDERVDDRIADKATTLAAMLNDRDLTTMALPDEEEYGPVIEDMGDSDALFAHLRD